MRAFALVVLAACGSPAASPATAQRAGSAVATTPACTRVVFGAHVVDAGSALMDKIRTHVAVEGGQSRTQGGAIRVEMEEWTDLGPGAPDGDRGLFGPNVYSDWFASAADRTALARFFTELAATDPALAVPADRTILFEAIDGGRWRSYLVSAEPAVTSSHIASAQPVTDAVNGRQILLTLTSDGKDALYKVTGENVGRKLALVLDGTVWKAPIVIARNGGGISIAMPPALTSAQIDALTARFTCSP